jgi:hypothetical protein
MSRTGHTSRFTGILPALREDIGSSKHIGFSTHDELGFYQRMKELMRVFYF